MGVTVRTISATDIQDSRLARLDARFYEFYSSARRFLRGLSNPVPLAEPLISYNNGPNLPASSYADPDEDAGALYASVAPFTLFAFRVDRCIPVRKANDGEGVEGLREEVSKVKLGPEHIAITRSAVPGIAWPATLAPADATIIPSGFVIRGTCAPELEPRYVSAILNHPVWRTLTTALSAGKAQYNLSQELLRQVPIPMVDMNLQVELGEQYAACLEEINELLENVPDLNSLCDGIVNRVAELDIVAQPKQRVTTSVVTADEVLATRDYRLDGRWHSHINRAVREALGNVETHPLSKVLLSGPAKRTQPRIYTDVELEDDSPRVIATASIQAGQIVDSLTKPTDETSVSRLPLVAGDLLVAMDGVGSLGKAAVYTGTGSVTVDSHVSVCKLRDITTAQAVACFLNSTAGRTQSEAVMSGATGQTSLSPTDLLAVRLPAALINRRDEVAAAYNNALTTYSRVARSARAILCRFEASLTQSLIDAGALSLGDAERRDFTDDKLLAGMLERLYPSVWS